MTSNGDLIVCGVSEDKLVEDIGVMVPKGDAVPVPGHLANQSKDLWRLLSQGVIFRLNENSLLRVRGKVPDPMPQLDSNPGREQLEVELAKLREENQELVTENGRLFSATTILKEEVKRLRAVLAAQQGQDTKLDAILELVKSRPQVVTQVVSTPISAPEVRVADVDDSAPLFIPSQIKSDSPVEGRVSLKEEASDASTLTDASKALKGMRKKPQ